MASSNNLFALFFAKECIMRDSEQNAQAHAPFRARFFSRGTLAAQAMWLGIPLLAAVLSAAFLFAAFSAEKIANRAITRNAQLQARAIGASLEHMLAEARNLLLLLASGPVGEGEITGRPAFRALARNPYYREISFIGLAPQRSYLLLNHGGETISLDPRLAMDAVSGQFAQPVSQKPRGHVSVGRPVEITYQLAAAGPAASSLAYSALRFSTPVYDDDERFIGVLGLSLDLDSLRDGLSGQHAGGEWPVGFFFDTDGWMLFHSGDEPGRPFRLDAASSAFRGDFGRPGFSGAFRPAPEHLNYWTMISEVQADRAGLITIPAMASSFYGGATAGAAVSFAPVTFSPGEGETPVLVGGLGLLDPSFSTAAAGRSIFGVFACCFMASLALLSFCLWRFSRGIGNRLDMLAKDIGMRNGGEEDGQPGRPDRPGLHGLESLPPEMERVRKAVDEVFKNLSAARSEQRMKARNAIWLRGAAADLPEPEPHGPCGLVGESPAMRRLLGQITRAAAVDCDVLVTGETGTGKELVSESIHLLSARKDAPFLSINCGALDENLLMDTLFGHVRGAFSEARQNRKGAFLAAMGGTLLLDEVGNATPKVQQALLRALSTRCIRPLGSDKDVPFDTRIIAATNAPLRGDAQDFRNDLYYRLAVIAIETPPLRARREDIPALIVHFLRAFGGASSRSVPGISRGALEKMMTHDWPGNVRELKNIVTRAMAFCDDHLIQAEDINLDGETRNAYEQREFDKPRMREPAEKTDGASGPELASAAAGPGHCPGDAGRPGAAAGSPEAGAPEDRLAGLNDRQRRLWPHIAALDSISRQEYQQLAGEEISPRTAQYDLGLLVSRGLLRREGRGPSQRYIPIAEPVAGASPA